ncbi:hypothetical protein ARTHRO9V_160208 [Arthrobacter sp. 9V]|nr:hypothetical protein ARTHRO9V_160208 [Arthrobacter sp. 9V]
MLFEGFLERAERASIGKVLYRPYGPSIALRGKSKTRSYSCTIEKDRTRTAHSMLTPQLRSIEVLIVSQMVSQSIAGINSDRSTATIYFDVNVNAVRWQR